MEQCVDCGHPLYPPYQCPTRINPQSDNNLGTSTHYVVGSVCMLLLLLHQVTEINRRSSIRVVDKITDTVQSVTYRLVSGSEVMAFSVRNMSRIFLCQQRKDDDRELGERKSLSLK